MGTLPAYGWYLRHVKNVSFTDCEFGFEKAPGRPAFVIDDTEKVSLNNTSLPIGSECSSRIAIRGPAKNFTLRNCAGLPEVRESVSDRVY